MRYRSCLRAGLSGAAFLFVSACAPSGLQWVREGAGPDDFRRDRADCLDRAGDFDFMSGGRRDESREERPIDRSQGQIYRTCLEALGYRQVRVNTGRGS